MLVGDVTNVTKALSGVHGAAYEAFPELAQVPPACNDSTALPVRRLGSLRRFVRRRLRRGVLGWACLGGRAGAGRAEAGRAGAGRAG